MPAPSTTKSDVVSEALQMSSVRRRLWGSELAGLQVSCWMREPGRCVHRPCAAGTAGDALRWLSARIAQCVCPVAACLRCAGHNGPLWSLTVQRALPTSRHSQTLLSA